ncbi:MAG TPA: carboxypeptidase-like regulatory domain-containing protein [Terriglobales bacterium]|nr:carboxypeptidase-like regulatory domain-containing protein [Terriglobales bacterium]HKS74815.1 carboxypeptidase-like regulatory domain-containing protein [Terriglobales bacterium]
MKKIFQVLFLTVLSAGLLFTARSSWAQVSTSVVRGTITDQQGKAVPGAKITLTNGATGTVRTTTSSDTGSYVFDLIEPATYQLSVEASGFKKQVVNNVVALVAKPTIADVSLQLGEINQTVEVTASREATLVNTRDATLGNNFDSTEIGQLPLEARSVSGLLSLQPGTTPDGYVTGSRADQSNVTLDGVDINNAQTGNAADATGNQIVGGLEAGNITNGPVLRLNAEAIEEFRVTTANGNADQGRSAGGQINFVTKSGTNQWHGAAFEFYRGTLFEANDWFSNRDGVARTPLVRNTFGGAFGGPIVKDKAFFFYSYEGRRDATASPVVEVVPLPNLGQGTINYTYCPDAACNSPQEASLNLAQLQQAYPDTGINQTALDALAAAAAKYPANDTSVGDGLNTGGFRFNSPTPVTLNSHVLKMDFNLTSAQHLFIRGNFIYDKQTLPRQFPDTAPLGVWSHPRGLAVGHTWAIGNWVNSFRYGLTRQAFTSLGDSTGNDIAFRFVFFPTSQTHPLSRITPVHNFTDDVAWTRGNHTFQFGGNVLVIGNSRVSFANAFDNAITNPSFYTAAGDVVSAAFQSYLDANSLPGDENQGQSLNSVSEVQNAATAAIGRFSQYTANFTFAKDGTLLPAGSAADRNFATQAYEEYFQDSWKARPDLTLTLGVRYSLERPVYETHGFEVQPTVPLGTYFHERLAAAAQGQNFSDPIVINKSGPANGGKPMYNWDKNNFQPRIAAAWSPTFESGIGRFFFPGQGKGVLRGGYALTNDYYGEALAVDWDLNNTLGFTSNFTTPANTFDITTANGGQLAPLFTGFNQDVRSLPLVVVPGSLVFPLSQPLDEGERIETSVDSQLHAPTEYVYNMTYERQLPAGTLLSLSYIGRMGRSLLARRDATAFNDIVDPKTGMDWYTAATQLEKQRQQGVDTSQIATIPFFEDLWPSGLGTILNNTFGLDPVCSASDPAPGFDPTWSNTQVWYALQSRGGGSVPTNPCFFFSGNDWTDTEALIDQVGVFGSQPFPTRFMQPQYGALSAWSTIGNSNYNAFALSLRQRLNTLTLDFNYTFAHSLDDASGLQTAGGYGSNNNSGPFIENPIRQRSNYGNSDFDIRHEFNFLALWQMPFGRGRTFFGSAHGFAQALIGGWQLSGILRWNTGLPVVSPFDDARWSTNWNVQSNVTPLSPIHTCPSRTGDPKIFGNCDVKAIYQGFRNAYPGETGPRNYLWYPGYTNIDMGLDKNMTMPWNEKQTLELRWEVFNVANYQPFGLIDLSRTGWGVVRDPGLRGSNPPGNFANFTNIQGSPRVMQIGARFSF